MSQNYRAFYWSNDGGLIITCVGWSEVRTQKIDYDCRSLGFLTSAQPTALPIQVFSESE